MSRQFDIVVLIGRFQPVHNGHLHLVKKALELGEHVVIVIGSSFKPATFKNPWAAETRHSMFLRNISIKEAERVTFEYNVDTIYDDDAWVKRVQTMVNGLPRSTGAKIGLIGHRKSDTDYLEYFPQWDFIDVPLVEPLDATQIRELYFKENANLNFLERVVPEGTMHFLREFKMSPAYQDIIKEREFIAKYKSQFASLPYPPVFVTTDAVVVQAGHILLVKRRDYPGKGLWALPGGFLNANTDASILDAMIRELREETGIKVPEPVLRGSITKNRVFDHPGRSARGRTITHAFRIDLKAGKLPKVKGSDDAEKAVFVPLADLRSNNMFEDHFEIIQCLVG
jgi:bifunctional NMN adenylyltransferase/nudix hydrolase